VPDTDKSITYLGKGTGSAVFCPDGTIIAGQQGCYNVPSKCSPSAAMGQSPDSAAEFMFNGSAIYVTGLLFSISPIYTVNLDRQSTDVDGVRPSPSLTCSLLFSLANLDPNVDHIIKLSIKGPSPKRNMTLDPQGKVTVFGLVNFIYTLSDGSATHNTPNTNPISPSAADGLSMGGSGWFTLSLRILLAVLASL